jgi:MFS family permease
MHPTSTRSAFWVVAYVLFIANAGGNLLSPLYEMYREQWHFDASDLTIIYAIYALVLIPGFPVFGVLSRSISPRVMMLGAILFVLLGSAIALGARNIGWLIAVRVCQGIGASR